MATRNELVAAVAERYARSTRTERGRILDEFVAVTGHHRKHAMRLLRGGTPGPAYERRSLGETAVSRYKAVIGGSLRARTLPAQKTEARVACAVLNRMTGLGMPISQRTA
jgi:hypothetical protein